MGHQLCLEEYLVLDQLIMVIKGLLHLVEGQGHDHDVPGGGVVFVDQTGVEHILGQPHHVLIALL